MHNSGNLVSDDQTQKAPPSPGAGAPPEKRRAGWKHLAVLAGLTAGLALCFFLPLRDWVFFSMESEFYSYMPLMPAITGYLIWIRRHKLLGEFRPGWGAAAAAAAVGGGILALYFFLAGQRGWIPADQDYLCVMMLAFLFLLLAAGFATLGTAALSAVAFPVAMLLFMVPYPKNVNDGLETFFQHTSASAAHGLFSLAGTPCVQDQLIMHLPTKFSLDAAPNFLEINRNPEMLQKFPTIFSLRVAPECSGIHSSQVLLITSLLAGNLFLGSYWRRIFLTLFIIPLAIVRNGFRIWVIGELCVHVNPHMIDSWIHHKGGPVFFALSLIPFFWVLVLLKKSESKAQNSAKTGENN